MEDVFDVEEFRELRNTLLKLMIRYFVDLLIEEKRIHGR